MNRDIGTTERLAKFLSQIATATENGTLRWTRQVGSAHRYANWNGNLLILGPDEPISNTSIPRYLFATPFDSPACIEINSNDTELGQQLMKLVSLVEAASASEPAADPFAVDDEILKRLVG
jgi:hypothetical protein